MGFNKYGQWRYEKGKQYSWANVTRFNNSKVKDGIAVTGAFINGLGQKCTVTAFSTSESKTSRDSNNNKSNDDWIALVFTVINTDTFVQIKVPAVYNLTNGTAHLKSLDLHISTSSKNGWIGKLKGDYAKQFYKNSAKGKKSK